MTNAALPQHRIVNEHPAVKRRACARTAMLCALTVLLIAPGWAEANDDSAAGTPSDNSGFTVWEVVEDGSWNYRGRPTVDVADGKLFISYVTSHGQPAIRSIDLSYGTKTTTVLASPRVDMHNNPSFTFDSKGRIVIFYSVVSGYSDQKQLARSTRPYDVSEFEVLHETLGSELTGNVGSQSGMWSDGNGTIFMQNYTVFGGARRELLFISEDDGETFREHTLWSFALEDNYRDRSYTYTFYDAGRNRLHFMALDRNMEVPMSNGLYYVYYDVEADRFYRANGDFAFDWSETPITDGHEYMDVITDPESGHSNPFWSSINVDANGNPYLTWSSLGSGEEYWSQHDGEQWRHHLVGPRTAWRTGSYISPHNPREVFLAAILDGDTAQIQKRRFDESSGAFVVAEHVSEEIPTDGSDRHVWAPSGPPAVREPNLEIVVWNYGRFTSQSDYRGAIHLASSRPPPANNGWYPGWVRERFPPFEILVLVKAGHSSEESVRQMGAWLQNRRPRYSVDFSADLSPDVLETETSLSQAQRELLESYDLILMPRYGVGPWQNFASTHWNTITTPLLNMNPFAYRAESWGWLPSGTETPTLEIREMVVSDPEHPVFDGIDVSDGKVGVFVAGEGAMQPEASASVFTGSVAGLTDRNEDGVNPGYPWVVTWEGTEESFYEGGSEALGGPRTLLLGENPVKIPTAYTADGQQLVLNAIDLTMGIADPADPATSPAGDGISNTLKFFLGGDPAAAQRELLPDVAVRSLEVDSAMDDYLTLTFTHRDPVDATYAVEVSPDLVTWIDGSTLVESVDQGDGTMTKTYRVPEPIGTPAQQFLRLKVTLP